MPPATSLFLRNFVSDLPQTACYKAPQTDTTMNKQITYWNILSAIQTAKKPLKGSERPGDKKRRRSTLESDPEKWFQYYFPDFYTAQPALFQIAATKRVMTHPEWFEVRAWSRELAKSSRTMMEVLYLILVGYPPALIKNPRKNKARRPGKIVRKKRKRNVLLISNSLENATRLLAPYKTNLEHNERIKNDYGIQENTGSWTADEFVTKFGVSFRAIGAGQSPRGTRNQANRPDIILFDDVDTDEDCRNPDIIRKRWNWIQEAVIPTRSISNSLLIIFCGNIIAQDCCVLRATAFADHTDKINIRDEQGKSTWEKNSEADIDRVLSLMSVASAQKVYFNNPINEGSVFNGMHFKTMDSLPAYEILVCYTDPSYKESKNNDFKATVLVGKTRDEFHVLKAFVFQGTVARMIDAHYEIMDFVGLQNCYYFIEQVFLQEMFLREFYQAGIERRRTVPVTGDKRVKPDKYMRIESLLEPLNRNGKLFLNETERDSPGMKMLAQQFLAFAPGSTAHDDGPDAVEGAIWIINNKLKALATGSVGTIERTRPNSKFY